MVHYTTKSMPSLFASKERCTRKAKMNLFLKVRCTMKAMLIPSSSKERCNNKATSFPFANKKGTLPNNNDAIRQQKSAFHVSHSKIRCRKRKVQYMENAKSSCKKQKQCTYGEIFSTLTKKSKNCLGIFIMKYLWG